MCIIRMYIRQDPNVQENMQLVVPDSRNIFLFPVNKQEVIHNQFQVCNILRRNGMNVYLHPQEIADNIQPQFLMLQLYILFCKFKNLNPVYGPPGTPHQSPEMLFKDSNRPESIDLQARNNFIENQTINTETSKIGHNSMEGNITNISGAQNISSSDSKAGSGTGGPNDITAESKESAKNMGIIEEEDSLDFSSSVRSLFQGHRVSGEGGF